jgi:hypothetical protein
MRIYTFTILGAILFSSSAFGSGYGDAGCGLGSVIFGTKEGIVQVIAATTNGTFGSQTFGITSGTSNCGEYDGKSRVQIEQADFVLNNLPGLAKSTAAGEGEELRVLAELFGCPATEATRFSTVAQQNYGTIFASEAMLPADTLKAIRDAVTRNRALSAACVN